jgi:hypothetical protein
MLGVSIAKRVWPQHSTEWNAALDARRVYDYRSQQLAKLGDWDYVTSSGVKRLVALLETLPREQDVMIARLRAHHIDPTPPAGWQLATRR